MPQKINLNATPYFDDFDPDKNYYRVLFRPGQSIQTRELTTLQSILQNQIESFGRFTFKQGQQVIPGEVGLNKRLDYVKLSSVSEVGIGQPDGTIVYKKYDIKTLIGSQLKGVSSGVIANVVEASYATNENSDTIFVKYINSGDDNNERTFRQGETLEVVGGVNTPLLVVGVDGSVLPTSINLVDPITGESTVLSSPAMGYGSAVDVREGVYFINGYFVRNDEQILVIDKYSDKTSAKIGFNILEDIITPEEDSSLYDNARGYSNVSAPGAHRFKISLELVRVNYSEKTNDNFVQLLQINQGTIEKEVKPADYSLLEDTLARRTYDESGDYVVDNFSLDIREYYQKNGNNGIYKLDDATGKVNELDEEVADSKMVLSVGSGKAYVRGFEIVNKETKSLEVDKARDTLVRNNVTLKTSGLSSYKITNLSGTVPLNTVGGELTSYPDVYLNSAFNDGTIGLNGLEDSDYFKKTFGRRSQEFGLDLGIKTIYVQLLGTTPEEETSFPDKLWFSKTVSGGEITSADFVDVVGYSIVNRLEVSESISQSFLEFTVLGKKSLLDTYLLEYDESSTTKLRFLWANESDVFANDPEGDLRYGIVVDYNDTLHPVVGLTKPKNYSLVKRPSGFNSDKDIILSKGRSDNGTEPYSAVFNFSYFNPTFFTKLKLDTKVQVGFRPGKYIFGRQSKAYGVIESDPTLNYSFGRTLFVTTLSGTFLPGETIVDEDGNSIRIAEENTISHFVINYRGNSYSSEGSSRAKIVLNGREYDSTVVELKVLGGQIYAAEILRGSELSEKYTSPPVVTISPTVSVANRARITAVLNKNTVLTYNNQNIKSLSSVYDNYKFTADIDTSSSEYASITQVSNFTFSGERGRKYITCNGFGTDLSKDLVVGDLIQYTDTSGRTIKNIVQSTTNSEGSTKSRVYLDYALTSDVDNATVVRIRPIVENATKSSLIFPTGSKQLSSMVNDTEDTKFKYYVRKDFVTDLSSSGNNITFSAQLTSGTQRFATFNENNFIVTVLDKGDSTAVEDGDIIYIDPSFVQVVSSSVTSSSVTSGALVISLPNNFFNGPSQSALVNYPKLKLTATIEIDKARPKIKTAIKNRRLSISSSGDRVIPLRGQNYDTKNIETLSYSDVYRLLYVYEGTTTTPPEADASGKLISGTDVTYKYTFDDGQRDTFYDISRIVLKPGFDAPTGQLLVAFDYFEHSSGDFCVVDSYTHQAGVPSTDIPLFNSSVYGTVSLKDVIDFRPKVDTTSTISGFQDVSILSISDGRSYSNFTGSGGISSLTPAPDSNLEYTFSFTETQYLDRMDGVFLNKKGQFIVKKGNSSLNPSKPESVDDAIAIAYLHIPAFTNTSKDVRIIPVDNKRYTMRDIGKLEKRIERLEYYTTLSILEQQALNMQIKDEIGLDRFKSGFVVDNFEAHSIGNLSSVDYKCSIDSQQSVLRAQSKEDSFRLIEVNTREDQRVRSGYVNNHGIITLPFQNFKLLGNNNATGTINPNPFVVIQYVGDVGIYPTVDQWYDTSVEPLVVDTNTKINSIFLAKENPKESLASLYDSFVVNWIGTDKTLFNINSLSEINSENVNASTSPATVASSSNVSPQNNELGKGINSKIVNGNSVSTALQFFARSIPVKFVVSRLKANTKIYVFMEGRNIGRWVAPDNSFTGIAGNSIGSFGSPLTTDNNGNLSGIILIPAGKPPQLNARWTGSVETVLYDENEEEIRFTEGAKTIRFTSSNNNSNKEDVDTYAEVKYYSTGIVPQNPQSIISTDVSYFKANEGVQLVNSNTDLEIKPNPLAQTFKIENNEGGVFVTGVDLFFAKKSNNIPVRAYLSNVDSGKPGKNILPGSECVMYPETYLKVYLTGDVDTITVKKNELITGKLSGAVGPLLKVLDKNGIQIGDDLSTEFLMNKEQVYTFILSNHNGVSFIQKEDLIIPAVTEYNSTKNKSASIVIAKDSGRVVDLKIREVGEKYNGASITIESPQLPGGSTATADIKVSNGSVYNVELVLSGKGYTEAPSIIIKGIGTGATGAVVDSVIEIDTPAVRMGVASDSSLGTPSTIPTKFHFAHPIYLQNNAEYALNVETDSIDYELWVSKLGQEEITTNSSVTTQPSLGSVYKSQNTGNWTEDIFEDLKFTLYRAEFDITNTAELKLSNENLGYELLNKSPFETSVRSPVNATSSLFKGNNAVVKLNHRDNGYEDSGKSYVFFKGVEDVGGISSTTLNNNLFKVSNTGVDTYNIISPSRAGSNIIGGGKSVLATYNRKYEKLYAQIPYLQLNETQIDTFIKTTNIVPIDSNTKNYVSYSQSDYEKTFLNESQYFINQKVIASRINETLNGLDRSLEYKILLSSSNRKLSPVIDLNIASVKTISNRIENATGYENRYGKRYQLLKFLSSFEIVLSIVGIPDDIDIGTVMNGLESGATGTIVEWDGSNTAVVNLNTKSSFVQGEQLKLVLPNGSTITSASASVNTLTEFTYEFAEGGVLVAYYPLDLDVTYDNTINGKIISWDPKNKVLTVDSPYTPINDDFSSEITTNSAFVRNEVATEQQEDIFRVNDIVKSSDNKYLTIGEMVFDTGVDYVSEIDSKNSSSVAKYVTKEVFIENPGTSIDVRITANVRDTQNIKLFYKLKKASSQENFDDINWEAFNIDGNPDTNQLAVASNSVSGNYEKQSYYQEFKYSISNLSEFSSYAIKIVMKTDDPCYPPKIQDLRAVASY